METATVRSVACAPLRKRVAFYIGEFLASTLRNRATSVESGGLIGSTKLVDRIIRNGIRAKAIRASDFRRLRDLHRSYWQSQAHEFASECEFRFREQFLADDAAFLDNADDIVVDLRIERVVEVGCGNGLVLQFLAERWPSVAEFIGIDIDPVVIDRNIRVYDNDRLKFVTSDASEWLHENEARPTLLMTNGGVLEYFLRDEVEKLFKAIRNLRPSVVLLIETLGSDHDLDHDSETRLYGRELSFSHNYPHLLRECGFDVKAVRERTGRNGDRWLNVLGVAGRA